MKKRTGKISSGKNTQFKRGYTLIQMIVTISMMSLILTITISAMVSLMKKSQSASNYALHRNNMNRFSLQFRKDIHQAEKISIINKDDKTELIINKNNEENIIYRPSGNVINREDKNKEERVSIEAYHFMPETIIEFSRNPDTRFMEAIISSPAKSFDKQYLPKGYLPLNPVHIIARIGRDLRFQNKPISLNKNTEPQKN